MDGTVGSQPRLRLPRVDCVSSARTTPPSYADKILHPVPKHILRFLQPATFSS